MHNKIKFSSTHLTAGEKESFVKKKGLKSSHHFSALSKVYS